MKNWFKKHPYLATILGVALLLRLVGIGYGLPYFFVGDEQSQLGAALVMLKNFNFAPGTAPQDFQLLYYPPVMSYFYVLVLLPVLALWMIFGGLNPGELAQKVALDPGVPWLAGRVLVAIIGVLSVYMIYLLGRKVFSERVGLLAAFFLATSFLHVSLSHFTRHWVATTFFGILAGFAAFHIWRFGTRRDYFWAAVFVAMSFGVGFIGIVVGFFPVVAHFARRIREIGVIGSTRDKNLWLFLVVLAVLVAVIVLLYPQRFLDIFRGTDISVAAEKSLAGFFKSLVFHFRTVLLADPVLFVLGITGVIWGIRVARAPALTFSAFAIIYISSLYFFIHDEPRYVSFLYPGLAIFAALPANMLLEKLRGPRFAQTVSGVILLVFLAYPLAISARFSWILTKKDSRILAKEWVENNLASQTKILSFLDPEVLTLSKEAIRRQQALDPSSLRIQDRVLLDLPEEKYPQSYNVLNVLRLSKAENLDQKITEFSPEYAVVPYWNLPNYLKIPSKYRGGPEVVRFVSETGEEPVDFTGNFDFTTFLLFKENRLGPAIEIHKQ